MKKLLVFFLIFMAGIDAHACRYTIREIAYSNLMVEQYRVVLEADSVKNKKLMDSFNTIGYAWSIHSNVEFQFRQNDNSAPGICFELEQGKELYKCSVENTNDILDFLDRCLNSSLQKNLIKELGKAFAVILYFEGDSGENADIENLISKAKKNFTKVAAHLDKAVTEEIKVLRVPGSDYNKNASVLSALTIPKSNRSAVVAIIYGRGRIAGSLLQKEEITSQNIFKKLVLLGTDCECGIDLSPLLNRALPLSWSAEVRSELAETLGFDVDNPLVQAEMSGILMKGTDSNAENHGKLIPDYFELKKKDIQQETNTPGQLSSKTFSTTIVVLAICATLILLVVGVLFLKKK